jgi:mannosyltransferase
VLALVLAATNPLLVAAALSARPYALSALATTAAVAALFRWLEGGGTRWAWLFCAASIATLCLHLLAVLAPLSVLVAAVVLEPGMFRNRWRTLIPPLGLVLAAALAIASLGAGQRSQIAWIPTPFGGAQLRRALEGPASGGHTPYAIFVLAFALVTVAACLWRRGRGNSTRDHLDLPLLGILLAWAVLPTVTLVAGSLVRPVFLDRYVTASVPGLAIALALLATWAVGGSEVRFARRSSMVAGGVLLGVVTVILFFVFSVPAARLTYVEAVSQGTLRVHRVSSMAVREDRRLEMTEQGTSVHRPDG